MWQIVSNGIRSRAYHIKELAELSRRGTMGAYMGTIEPADSDNEPCFTLEHEKEIYKLIFGKDYGMD